MQESKQFKVGDRVRCLKDIMNVVKAGSEGIILYINPSTVGVEFDNLTKGHEFEWCAEDGNTNVKCKKGHGWWLLPEEIELITNEEAEEVKEFEAEEVKEFEAEEEAEVEEALFKVGDRVAYVGREIISEDVDKLLGTIVDIDVTDDARPYLVNFDTKIFEFDTDINGHTGDGKCPDGHGWWVRANEVKLTEPSTFKVGDRVENVASIYVPCAAKGTVCLVEGDSIGVDWDDFTEGHNFCDIVKCRDNHGWWVDAADISLISCMGKSLKAYVPECSSNPHYETALQPIEFMQANMTHEEFIGFLKGNIIKYTARCGKKDDVNKEVSKIIEYAKWLAKAYKGETINPRESN